MKRTAKRLERLHRVVAVAVATSALVVVVLVSFGEILSAQDEDAVDPYTLIICSHPGATRLADGSLPITTEVNRTSIEIYSPAGDTSGPVNTLGIPPGNGGWFMHNYFRPVLALTGEHGDYTSCTFNMSIRVNGRTAVLQHNDCPVAAGTDTDNMGRPLVSIRVWLNNQMDPAVADQPCVPGSDGSLSGQTEPVPFRRPPGLSPPAPVQTGVGGSSGISENTGGSGNGGETPGQGSGNGGETPGQGSDDGGETPGQGSGDGGETPSQASGNGAETPEEDDANGSGDGRRDNQTSENGQEARDGDDDAGEEADAGDHPDQDHQQQSSDSAIPTEEGSEQQDVTDNEDAAAGAEGEATDGEDLMEADAPQQEAEPDELEEDAEQGEQAGIPSPRTPRTGSGGIARGESSSDWVWVLTGSLLASAVIAGLLLVTNRRSTLPKEQ